MSDRTMQHQHRHGSASHGGTEHRGNHRSASASVPCPDQDPGAPAATSGHPGLRGETRRGVPGPSAAAVCVMLAFFGLAVVLIAEIIARTNREPAHAAFNVLAGAAVLGALATGVYAQATQVRHWSRRVKRRLLIGLPVALLNAAVVIANVCGLHAPPAAARAADAAAPATAAAPAAPEEDRALLKPGWYGELRQDGLMLVVNSFGSAAAESRQFCRRLSRPVSYATLSAINLGTPEPAVLQSLEVGLRLDTGETVQSLPVRPLLAQRADANAELLRRLKAPCTLAAGAMLPDLPICQEADFPWAKVTAVTVVLGPRVLTVPGRMMTAEERQSLLDRAAESGKARGGTNVTAEAWFKNL